VKLRIGDCGLRIVTTTFSFFNLQSAIRNPQFHHQLRGIAAGTTPLKKRRPNLVNGEK